MMAFRKWLAAQMTKLRWLVILLAPLPLLYAVYQVYLLEMGLPHNLGADPAEALVHLLGEWALYFLILTLLISPLRNVIQVPNLVWLRRPLGLAMFSYGVLHLSGYFVFLLGLQFSDLFADILQRPYITVGMLALAALLPLALTSTNAARRKLGPRWGLIHRLIYPAAVLVVVHLIWIAKSDYGEAVLYGGILLVLLAYRAFSWRVSAGR